MLDPRKMVSDIRDQRAKRVRRAKIRRGVKTTGLTLATVLAAGGVIAGMVAALRRPPVRQAVQRGLQGAGSRLGSLSRQAFLLQRPAPGSSAAGNGNRTGGEDGDRRRTADLVGAGAGSPVHS